MDPGRMPGKEICPYLKSVKRKSRKKTSSFSAFVSVWSSEFGNPLLKKASINGRNAATRIQKLF